MSLSGPILIFGAENHSISDDIGPQGGAVDLSKRLITTTLSTVDFIKLDGASSIEDQTYEIEGIDPNNQIMIETVQIGQTSTSLFIRINKITKISGSPLTDNITVIGETTKEEIGILASTANSLVGTETTTLLRLLNRATTSPYFVKDYYEKFFIRNVSDSIITDAKLSEAFDPENSVTFTTDLTINDNAASLDRVVRPPDVVDGLNGFIKNTIDRSIPNLSPGNAIGVWIRVRRNAGDTVVSPDYSLRFVGTGSTINLVLPILVYEHSLEFLSDIISKRNLHPLGGGNPHRFVELVGGKFAEQLHYEPDPETFRDQFYYNTRLNRLYKKLKTKPKPVWKSVR